MISPFQNELNDKARIDSILEIIDSDEVSVDKCESHIYIHSKMINSDKIQEIQQQFMDVSWEVDNMEIGKITLKIKKINVSSLVSKIGLGLDLGILANIVFLLYCIINYIKN